MKDYFKAKTWLITTSMFVIAFGLSSAIVYYEFGFEKNIKILNASASNNVTGWAWNANTGWISFNCTNDTPACSGTNYGVSVDLATGYFSGYAWSASLGWISFNRKTCVGGSDAGVFCGKNSDCTSNNCRLDGPGAAGEPLAQPFSPPASPDYNAIYSFSDNTVTGWAKILSLGDNGWVKLRKYTGDSGADYGVSINPATGSFSGFGWNANDSGGGGAGWISFNCAGESPACGGTNYKVVANINRPPSITAMTAPNWNYAQASANALHANLLFNMVDADTGSFGSAYQVIITKADNTAVLDTGKCTGFNAPSVNCKVDNSICLKNGLTGCINPGDCVCQFPLQAELNYNTGYKWSVKVWDNFDTASVLTSYNTSPDTDNNDGVAPTFTTYKHKFPVPVATYFPANPSRGEKVKFTDASQTYTTAAPATTIACAAANCAWLWTIPAGATIDDAATSTPTIIFNTAGSNSLKLKVTDRVDGYWTEITILLSANAKLPGWKEVKPE